MSGGGGGYIPSDPKTILQRIQESEAGTQNAQYESEVVKLLSSFLVHFNDRDIETVNRHLGEIKKAIEKEIDGSIDLLYGGSVAKRTYVNGLSDIDSLVILDKSDLSHLSPNEVRDYLRQRIKERFPNHEVSAGNLAVTIKFSDSEIQLLPAIRQGGSLKIADKTGNKWSSIQPEKFTTKLTEVNKQNSGKIVPIIKLAKAIIATLPESHRVSGYHAESLAIQAFRSYTGESTYKAMLAHYFKEASTAVRSPIKDSSRQSVHVDEYLGNANSLERRIISDTFSRIARRMRNADSAASLAEWQKMFEK
ncbi:MAG: nucleotidyltransferase [Ignavibacteriae bacterium]|nr:nucleotidyltransferase [Ignavibacteriota bacterium]MCB9215677.1 nucleotidyltransferase [Ignavibacteria bacterium]